LKQILKKSLFPVPSKWIFWILLALVFKAVIPLLMILHGHRPDPHLLGFGFIGDTPSYIDPIENLLANGHYSPDRRMPGYGIIYLFFRQFFLYTGSYNCMVILQLIVASIGVYCMALLTRILLKSDSAFYLCFYLFLISTYSNYYDICLMTESLTTSFLIFGAWFFALYFFFKKIKHLLVSGFFLAWVVFLRPAFAPVIIIFCCILILYAVKNKELIVKPVFLLVLPFCVFEGAWIYRNYNVHNKFIPLFNGIYYPYIDTSYMKPMFLFVQSWGGANDIPESRSAMSCFGGVLFPGEPEPKAYDSIPDYIYTSKFNKDSVMQLRKLTKAFIAMQKPAVDSFYNSVGRDWNKAFRIFNTRLIPINKQAAICQEEIIRRFNTYTESVKKESPFLYYVKAPLIFARNFLYRPDHDIFKRAQIGKLGILIELFYTYFYFVILNMGLIGMIILSIRGFKSEYFVWVISLVPLSNIIIHSILVRVGDNRYLMPVWPFIIACATYLIIVASNKIRGPINS